MYRFFNLILRRLFVLSSIATNFALVFVITFVVFYEIFCIFVVSSYLMFFFYVFNLIPLILMYTSEFLLKLSFFLVNLHQIIFNKRLNLKMLFVSGNCVIGLNRKRRIRSFCEVLLSFWNGFFILFFLLFV